MKKRLLFLLLIVSFTQLYAQKKNSIIGTWLTEEKDGKIEIFEKNNKFFGKTVWAKTFYKEDGKTLIKDVHNPDKKLRSRPLKNMIILKNLQYKNGEWIDGTIYDPTSGKTYKCKVTYKYGKVHLRGYIGMPILGKTTTWTRTD